MRRPRWAGCALVLLASSVWVAPVRAQDDPDTLVVPLQEVVVIGSRVPEELLRVPAAVSVVDRRTFGDGRGINLKEALARIPGVFVQSRSGAQDARITIRGFGARGSGERSNTGTTRGIRVLSDGLPITEPDGRTALDLADLAGADRVEVSRSNASAVYGNASGGVIHLRTRLDFEKPYLELRERAGSFGFHREQATTGFTIGPGRGTVSLLNSTLEGWREHSSSNATLAQARFATPLDDRTRLGISLDAISDLNRYPGPLTKAELDSIPDRAAPAFVQRDDRRRNRIGRLGLSVERQVEASQSFSFAAFVEPKALQRSERNRFRDFTRHHVGGNALYRLRSTLAPDVEAIATIGADEQFQDGSVLFYNLAADGSRGTALVANKREGANAAGGFMQGELRWRRWSARLAGRYDNLWYISEDFIDPVLDATKHFTRWTPKGSLAYLLDHHTVYAAVGGGVEAPAFNEIDPPAPFDTVTSFNPFLEPMRSTSYELGMKGGLPVRVGGLSYDVALYWIDVRNDIIPFNGGAYFFTAGKTRRRGVELGLDWRASAALGLDGALTVSNNEYRDYVNDLGDFRGNRVAGLPEIVAQGGGRYRLPHGFEVRGDVEYVGDYYADDANTATVDAHTLLGAGLAWQGDTQLGRVRAFVSADNLTDEAYAASVFINGVGGRFYEPGPPRNWSAGVTLTY